jgi:hypothetical protein
VLYFGTSCSSIVSSVQFSTHKNPEAPADDGSWPSGSSKGGAMLTVLIIIAALEFIGLVYLGEAALRRL